jgi:hypothetical protein
VVVLDVFDPVCVYTLISVEIKTWSIDFVFCVVWDLKSDKDVSNVMLAEAPNL